ncbi:hypothetical protein ABVN80_15790 [Acinetobacter baumannii]
MSKSLLLQLNKPSQNGPTPKDQRAQYLKRAADLMESRIQELMVSTFAVKVVKTYPMRLQKFMRL